MTPWTPLVTRVPPTMELESLLKECPVGSERIKGDRINGVITSNIPHLQVGYNLQYTPFTSRL